MRLWIKPLTKSPCAYQRGTWECRGDGYLWDADNDGYDSDDREHPCPACNTRQYLLCAKEFAESCSDGNINGRYYTGEDWWQNAVRYARRWNKWATFFALLTIGKVEALRPANNSDLYETVRYAYGLRRLI